MGSDYLSGGTGNDLLNAGDGDDVLSAGDGADTLNAGVGDEVALAGDGDGQAFGGAVIDYLQGDTGADTFAFQIGDGTNKIADFEDGINITEMSWLTFADLTLTSDTTLGKVYADYGSSDQITIKIDDVTLVDQNDFNFV